MDEIKVQSHLTKGQYIEITFLLMIANRAIWYFYGSILIALYFLLTDKADGWKSGNIPALAWLVLFGLLIPVFTYFVAGRTYGKNKALSEIKVYTFTSDQMQCTAAASSISSAWTNMAKVKEKVFYFLIYPTKYAVHYIPKSGFESAEQINQFRQLIIDKGIKNNFNIKK